MTSKETGLENTLDVTLDGADWGMTELKAAQDAEFTINSLAVTSSNNFVDDVIDGISIELDKVHDSGDSSVIKVEYRYSKLQNNRCKILLMLITNCWINLNTLTRRLRQRRNRF